VFNYFGSVWTSTLPTGSLPNTSAGSAQSLPDAATGLVHLGGGRYYDPAIGRPLQPNTAGALPTMPQALNRYTAAAAGQPGVLQAAASDPFNWAPHFVNLVENTAVESARNHSVVTSRIYEGVRPVAVRGSRHTITHHLPDALQEFPGRFVGIDPNDMFYLTRMRVRANSELRIGSNARGMAAELTNTMPAGSRVWVKGGLDGPPRIVGEIRGPLEEVARKNKIRSGLGFGLDFAIGFGFQFAEDSQNPYLTSNQVIARSIISGGGGAVFSSGAVLLACGASGGIPCVVIAGVGGGLTWAILGQPNVFQWLGLSPADRNLGALNVP
jgi:hypothetical protein